MQKGKHRSSLLRKACQISSYYFLLHRHFNNGHPLVQTVNKTMAAVAYNHRSCWRLFIKQSTLLIVLTPGNRLIYTHFVRVYDVVDLDNKQVKVDSLHKHPTESCHQKILQKGRHCDTTTLRRKKNKWLKRFKG